MLLRGLRAFGLGAPVHVNVSTRRLTRPDLHVVIDWALGRYKLEAGRLVIEIANTNQVEHAGVASKAIQRIRDRGVRMAIDDFGSGYDIMAQLQNRQLI
jgi:diguanylate cyclase